MAKNIVTFITGNQNKLRELQKLLSGTKYTLASEVIDLPEVQGTREEISIEKVKHAHRLLKKPVLIEDTSLCFNALGGMPGPYVRWFEKSCGNTGLYKMLHGFEDKSAYAMCTFALITDNPNKPLIFEGKCDGTICEPVNIKNSFGWDPIFKVGSRTFAEMSIDEKNKISHRAMAVNKLINFLNQ